MIFEKLRPKHSLVRITVHVYVGWYGMRNEIHADYSCFADTSDLL